MESSTKKHKNLLNNRQMCCMIYQLKPSINSNLPTVVVIIRIIVIVFVIKFIIKCITIVVIIIRIVSKITAKNIYVISAYTASILKLAWGIELFGLPSANLLSMNIKYRFQRIDQLFSFLFKVLQL